MNNNTLINIWQQFSQMYGKRGQPLTSQEFSRYWNDGKGWIIGEDGIVMNFKDSWQKENGVTADNPALSGDAWTKYTTEELNNNWGLSKIELSTVKSSLQYVVNSYKNSGRDINNIPYDAITLSYNKKYGLYLKPEQYKEIVQSMMKE